MRILTLSFYLGSFIATATAQAYTSNAVLCADATGRYTEQTDFFASQTFERKIQLDGKVVHDEKLGTVSVSSVRRSVSAVKGRVNTDGNVGGKWAIYDLEGITLTDAASGAVVFYEPVVLCRRVIGGGKYIAN